MEKKFIQYLLGVGIDLSADNHPYAKEYNKVKKLGNPEILKCYEHLLMLFILDIERIKKFNNVDYQYYLTRIKAFDTSFWGQRFEISWYSTLISRFDNITNLRRGIDGLEADFVFDYDSHQINIETTSAKYTETSKFTNPISKLKSIIANKERKSYSNLNCCLIIDFTNLSFYRKIANNFSTTLSSMIKDFHSDFGIILFQESAHEANSGNPNYYARVFDFINPNASPQLLDFFYHNFKKPQVQEFGEIFFKTI